MARKGNLLYNGDFETGTTEGWEEGPYGSDDQFLLLCLDVKPYRGNYHGYLGAEVDDARGQYAYNKICDFEEHEAYLYVIYIYKDSGAYANGLLFGLDDKNNLIDKFLLGRIEEEGVWHKCQAILRGFGDITHFKVGLNVVGYGSSGLYYFDEAKLMPLKSVKSHVLAYHKYWSAVSENKSFYVPLACIGRCKFISSVQTFFSSGTDPTLDIDITIAYFGKVANFTSLSHTQISGDGFSELTAELPEVSYIQVNYTLGGTDPSFDIIHDIRIQPL